MMEIGRVMTIIVAFQGIWVCDDDQELVNPVVARVPRTIPIDWERAEAVPPSPSVSGEADPGFERVINEFVFR